MAGGRSDEVALLVEIADVADGLPAVR